MIAPFAAIALAVQSLAPALSVDFSTASPAPGRWSFIALPGASEATFTDSSGAARLVIRCNLPLRRVSISRVGSAPAASVGLWTSSAARTLPARFDPAARRVTVDMTAFDPLLDALAFSRGRFAVSLPGFAPLVVPTWPEPARAVEDCRS